MPTMFQSPSLRGSGRFQAWGGPGSPRRRVSIPFIAGQWSLLYEGLGRGLGRVECFNPLHCGAVVASPADEVDRRVAAMFQSPSLRGSGRFAGDWWFTTRSDSCFNPLHCGAVVASRSTAPD